MLFDSISIENYIFSLLHAEIGIGNKIIDSFYSWITKYIEPLSNEKIKMSKIWLTYKLNKYKIKNNLNKSINRILQKLPI